MKNGDIIFEKTKEHPEGWICILREKTDSAYYDYCFLDLTDNTLEKYGGLLQKKDATEIRQATEEEKNLLFYALEKQNLRWNAEEKKLYFFQTRLKRYELYFYIGADQRVYQVRDYYMYFDDEMFRCKNYFKTKDEAQKYADEIKDILNKREL